MKTISKSGKHIFRLREEIILRRVDSPFVVRLITTYKDPECVHFLLDVALGGELYHTYETLQLYGSETHASFYVACVTEALAHLHERDVMYRDLKPENMLLDSRGYCKITDFGLAKVASSSSSSYTFVGTPGYLAPEMIMRSGHGRSVDWWMLGVLQYELLTGQVPFEAHTCEQTYELWRTDIDIVQFPSCCRASAVDLVKRLCRQNPEERLTAPEVRDHWFFSNFDWVALQTLQMQPPFQPTVNDQRDLSNFRQFGQQDTPLDTWCEDPTNWDTWCEDLTNWDTWCEDPTNWAVYLPPPPSAQPPPPPTEEPTRIRDEGASEVERHEIEHPYMSGVEGYLVVEVGEAVLIHYWEGADEWEAGGWCYGCAETNTECSGWLPQRCLQRAACH